MAAGPAVATRMPPSGALAASNALTAPGTLLAVGSVSCPVCNYVYVKWVNIDMWRKKMKWWYK